MKSSEGKKNIDQIITDHLKNKQQQNELNTQFTGQLMTQIHQLSHEQKQIPVFTTKAIMLPILLLSALVLLTFLYFYQELQIELIFGYNLTFENSVFQDKGLKYMLYSLAALMFFTVIDRFLQIKIHAQGK